jgi:acyl-CoA thioesterase YciA
MWANTSAENEYLPPRTTEADIGGDRALQPKRGSNRAAGRLIGRVIGRIPAWLEREKARTKLYQLDDRTLTDLGINRGDFPAILAGTFSRSQAVEERSQEKGSGPRGSLASRTLAMPSDANPSGHIFGGWIMALMDAGGAMTATKHADGRVVTASVSNIVFLEPVKVGDSVCCYTDLIRTGNTSMTLDVEIWVLRQGRGERVRVTEAKFTFVAVNDNGQPRRIAQHA